MIASLAEDVTQAGAAARNARFHSANRHIHYRGNILVGVALDIGKDDGEPLVIRKAIQRVLEKPAQFGAGREGFGVFTPRRLRGPLRLRLERLGVKGVGGSSLPGAEDVVGAVGRDSQQPRADKPAAEAVDRIPGADKRVLRCILRLGGIPQEAIAHGIDGALVTGDKLVERVEISRLGLENQLLVVSISGDDYLFVHGPPACFWVVTARVPHTRTTTVPDGSRQTF